MDFSAVELTDADRAFQHELRCLIADVVTQEVISLNRETGDNFDEEVHLAFGEAGYLSADWNSESDGGFSAVRRRIWQLEIGRAHTPWFHWGTTVMAARAVAAFGAEDLRAEVLPDVVSGRSRICLGYTEPEGGSDVATCKTRAVRDGDDWIINGSKMFTSNAHHAQFVFLVTNTDPSAPKHDSLTMFLVPLDADGIEIHPLRTIDGDRTNVTFYSDVHVADRYRVGAVNGGWTVLRGALDAEHGTDGRGDAGLQDISVMGEHIRLLAEAIDTVATEIGAVNAEGVRAIDDSAVAARVGRAVARTEAAISTPGMFGRVATAQTMRDVLPDLMNVLGTPSCLPADADRAIGGGAVEYLYRLAGPAGIYGGTLEVFRNMIAQHALSLGGAVHLSATMATR